MSVQQSQWELLKNFQREYSRLSNDKVLILMREIATLKQQRHKEIQDAGIRIVSELSRRGFSFSEISTITGFAYNRVSNYKRLSTIPPSQVLKRATPPMSVNDLELGVRAANCLNNAGIETIDQLLAKTDAELLNLRWLGKRTLADIDASLANSGLLRIQNSK